MMRLCAWCRALLGIVGDGRHVTHGLCEACADGVMVEANLKVADVWYYWQDDKGGEG